MFADVLKCTRSVETSECELVVMTTILQAVDMLRPTHAGPPNSALALTTCYFAIVDRATAEALLQDRTALVADCGQKVKGWTVVMVPDHQLSFQDARRDSRVIKVLLHLFFPKAKYHIYMDGNVELLQHPIDLVSELLIQNGTVDEPQFLLGMPRHNKRNSVEEELERVSLLLLDSTHVLQHQVDLYHMTNSPPMGPLFNGYLRVQAHRPLVRAFECLWWGHIATHSRRDQLSLVKVLLDLELVARTQAVSYELFRRLPHSHEAGRRQDLASAQVSSYLAFESLPPLPAQGGPRRVFLDHRSPNPREALKAFLLRVALYGMGEGWEVSLLAGAKKAAAATADFNLTAVTNDATVEHHSATLSGLAMEDLVVMRLYVPLNEDNKPGQLLQCYVADGTMLLVDLLIVEYASADPARLRSVQAVVDFRSTLHDVVANWGVLAMPHWDSATSTGWDERTWWLVSRRHAKLTSLHHHHPSSTRRRSLSPHLGEASPFWLLVAACVFFPIFLLLCAVASGSFRRAPA